MQNSLLRDIQTLLERTYSAVGVNLEECLIDKKRCRQLTKLAGAQARELHDLARTFLRRAGGSLHVGIYYDTWLIEELERADPRRGLNDRNIRALIVFVEEINHALHAGLKFQAGFRQIDSEDFARGLELQAMVDTYLVLLLFMAFFRQTKKLSWHDRRWLRFHLFGRESPAFHSQGLHARYMETTALARRYTHFLDRLAGQRRVEEIRTFHALGYGEQRRRILALPAPSLPREDDASPDCDPGIAS
ncbi:MAG: hypothetical protein ACFCU3_08905 [Verrucomicrobiales bacterium]